MALKVGKYLRINVLNVNAFIYSGNISSVGGPLAYEGISNVSR